MSQTALPGRARPWVTIRVGERPGRPVDRVRLEELIGTEIPAHVGYTLEILPAAGDVGGGAQ